MFAASCTILATFALSIATPSPTTCQDPQLRPTPVGPGTTPAHPAPAPGLTHLRPVLGTSHYEFLRRAPGDSLDRSIGRLVVHRSLRRVGSSAVLTNVAHSDWVGGRSTTDTTTSLDGTLAPIAERTRTPGMVISYDFDHLRVTGRMGVPDSLAAIDDTLPRPAFNSTDVDMLLTALPLARHFRVTLPLYDPEYPGFRLATLTVRGTQLLATPTGPRRAWVVALVEPSGTIMSYRVDVKRHTVLEKDFRSPGAGDFRVTLAGDRPA